MNPKKLFRRLILVVGIYALIYLLLSFDGQYSKIRLTGKHRYVDSGLAMPDTYIWEPWGVEIHPLDPGPLALFFWPMSTLDRKYWHHDISPFEEPVGLPK